MSNLQTYKEETFQPVAKRMLKMGIPEKTVMKELSFALQIINGSKGLRECTVESVISAVDNIANIGLTLNPAAKECYLIPSWNRFIKTKEAQLRPSYIGLKNKIIEGGTVTSITAQVVFENDEFKLIVSDNLQPVIHAPCLTADKGKPIGVYAIATLKNGTRQAEWIDIAGLSEIRSRSEGFKAWQEDKNKKTPWVTDAGEMMRKTVIRRLYKYLPEGNNKEQIQKAIELENQDYGATFGQIEMIEGLLDNSNISPELLVQIEQGMHQYTYQKAKSCIRYLKENQIEKTPRMTGGRGNMGDLDKAIAQAVQNPNT